MTRINVVPVYELSIPHLLAEYRELKHIFTRKIDTVDAPETYCLGKGHVKFGRKHSTFILRRYKQICEEMLYRGLTVNHPYEEILNLYIKIESKNKNDYFPTQEDLQLNRERIIQRLKLQPKFYYWGNRKYPEYFKHL